MITHILCSVTFFSEIRTVDEIMSKNVVQTEGPQMTSQHSAYALRAGLAGLYARMRMHTPTRLVTHMHVGKRKHAHTDQSVILSSTTTMICERSSLLHYTYITPLVFFYGM